MPGRKPRGMVGALRKEIDELRRQVTANDTTGSTPQTGSTGKTRTRQPRRNLHTATDTGGRQTGGTRQTNIPEERLDSLWIALDALVMATRSSGASHAQINRRVNTFLKDARI